MKKATAITQPQPPSGASGYTLGPRQRGPFIWYGAMACVLLTCRLDGNPSSARELKRGFRSCRARREWVPELYKLIFLHVEVLILILDTSRHSQANTRTAMPCLIEAPIHEFRGGEGLNRSGSSQFSVNMSVDSPLPSNCCLGSWMVSVKGKPMSVESVTRFTNKKQTFYMPRKKHVPLYLLYGLFRTCTYHPLVLSHFTINEVYCDFKFPLYSFFNSISGFTF